MKVQIACITALAATLCAGRSMAQSATPTPVDCDAVRCQVQSSISACLSNARNHGQCVSCVTRTIKGDSSIPRQCKGKIVRCAAHSTCGKPAFETCTTTQTGTCDTTTGACTDGSLAPGVTTCTSDADCIAGTRCSVMRAFPPNTTPTPGADRCSLRGGTPGTGSCCASCPTSGS